MNDIHHRKTNDSMSSIFSPNRNSMFSPIPFIFQPLINILLGICMFKLHIIRDGLDEEEGNYCLIGHSNNLLTDASQPSNALNISCLFCFLED